MIGQRYQDNIDKLSEYSKTGDFIFSRIEKNIGLLKHCLRLCGFTLDINEGKDKSLNENHHGLKFSWYNLEFLILCRVDVGKKVVEFSLYLVEVDLISNELKIVEEIEKYQIGVQAQPQYRVDGHDLGWYLINTLEGYLREKVLVDKSVDDPDEFMNFSLKYFSYHNPIEYESETRIEGPMPGKDLKSSLNQELE